MCCVCVLYASCDNCFYPNVMDTDDVNLEEDFDDGSDEGEPDYEYLNESSATSTAVQQTASRK